MQQVSVSERQRSVQAVTKTCFAVSFPSRFSERSAFKRIRMPRYHGYDFFVSQNEWPQLRQTGWYRGNFVPEDFPQGLYFYYTE